MIENIKTCTLQLYTLNMSFSVCFDGGANPNPGPCAGAFAIFDSSNELVAEGGRYIEHGTNNIGEYTGLLAALEKCVELGIKSVVVRGDSLLVISQVNGSWKVKNAGLLTIHQQIKALIKHFESIVFVHVRREFNQYADQLSDRTLEWKRDW